MATDINEHTGDALVTKVPSQAYLNNYDTIFRKKEKEVYNEDTQQGESNETPKD